MDNHLVQLDEHGVHPHLILTIEIVSTAIVVRPRRGRDDDKFIPHDAGLGDGDGGATRNFYAVMNRHGNCDASAVTDNILHLSDGNTREEHLRLWIEPNGTAKTCIEHIVMAAAEAQPAKEQNDRKQQPQSSQCKRANLRLGTHACSSLRWWSARKNACTRASCMS